MSVRERELEAVQRSWASDPDSTLEDLERAVEAVLRAPWRREHEGVDWSAFFLEAA